MLDFSEILLRLALAAVFGALVGLEREYLGKPAGTRTYSLVSIGSALYTIISVYGFNGVGDPSRIASQIVVGIGFLGAGEIIHRGNGNRSVIGLTTAAGLWVAAAIGMAIGIGWYAIGISTSVLVLIIFHLIGYIRFHAEHRAQLPATKKH